MKLCIVLAFHVIVVVNFVCSADSEWKCHPKTPYEENECNRCHCTETGALGCTEMACIGPEYQQLFNCEVGTTWEKECNQCWCVKDLGTICSVEKC